MIEFSCNIIDIQAAVEHIRVALPKRREERVKARVELDIKPDKVILSVVGASYTIDMDTGIFAKVFMPVLLLIRAVEVTKSSRLVMQCEDGKVRFGGTEISSPEIEVVHPENQSKIDLTMNYRSLDILQLRSQHPIDEIKRMGLLEKLLKTEEKMTEDLESASDLLKPYGVTYEELRELLERRIDKQTK